MELLAFVTVVSGIAVQVDVQLDEIIKFVSGRPPESLSDCSIYLFRFYTELSVSLFDGFLLRLQYLFDGVFQIVRFAPLFQQTLVAGEDHLF